MSHFATLDTRRRKASPANKLTQEVIKILNARGNFVWRNNNLATPGRKNNVLKGVPDIIGVTKKGMFIGIEIKIEDKQSEDQKAFEKTVRDLNGFYFIIHNLEELYNFINIYYYNI